MQKTETKRIEYKQQLTNDFEQEVIAFLNYKEVRIISKIWKLFIRICAFERNDLKNENRD